MRIRLSIKALSLLTVIASTPVSAIVASDNPDNWIAPSLLGLDGVGLLSINSSNGSGECSGSLLSGDQYLLTAAHCITDHNTGLKTVTSMSVSFKGGAITAHGLEYFVHSGYSGFYNSSGNGSDLAIVKLSTIISEITGFGLSPTFDLGSTFLMAGYGRIGTGATGDTTHSGGVLHYGFNVYETTHDHLRTTLFGSNGYSQKYGETYYYDFDDGSPERNAISRLYDFVGVSFTSDTGLNTANGELLDAEAMMAKGDSGGGEFILKEGKWLLSGVHSFGNDWCGFYLPDCDVVSGRNSSFGETGGSTAVHSNLVWINSIVQGNNAVPEPGSYLLVLLGLSLIQLIGNQRRPGTPACLNFACFCQSTAAISPSCGYPTASRCRPRYPD